MEKKQVAEILDEMGTLLELRGENPFKSRAYHNAARIIAALTEDLEQLVQQESLTEIPGIGQGISEVISDLVTTETSKEYKKLRASLPAGLIAMIQIPGLGPKRVKLLHDKLKIKSLGDLKAAAKSHRLSDVAGFGPKSEENILKGIERLRITSGKHLYPQAKESADAIHGAIKAVTGVKRSEIAGSLRRRKETIGDIDIVVSAVDRYRKSIIHSFIRHPLVQRIIGQGETKASVALKGGMNCDLRVVSEMEFPFALNYFTGSKEHNVEVRSLARKLGWSLNEYGFSRVASGDGKSPKRIPTCRSEEDLYKAVGLSYIPPELRENMGEFEAAREGRIPALVEESQIRGAFHCHTKYSDGANTLEEMTNRVKAMGWEYWGVADHSQRAVYTNGLSIERVKTQLEEIDRLNGSASGVRIFKGTECDILPDGSMDYPDDLLARFDYVVASIHSKFKMTEEEATRRIIKALKNKYVSMLGHPTGRLLLNRDGYTVKIGEVLQAAADHGKSIELNSHPLRLDLDWRSLKLAKEKGVKICINPDAHNADGLNDVQYGVGIARKGWLEASDIVNAWPTRDVEKYFETIRS